MLNSIEMEQIDAIVRAYGLTETIRAIGNYCTDRAESEPGASLAQENWRHDAQALRRITKPLSTTALRNGRDATWRGLW